MPPTPEEREDAKVMRFAEVYGKSGHFTSEDLHAEIKSCAVPKPEKYDPNNPPKLPNQEFMILLRLKTQCVESMTCAEVRAWTEEHFGGCDVGDVMVTAVAEEIK